MFGTQVLPREDVQMTCLFSFDLCSWIAAHLLPLENYKSPWTKVLLSKENGRCFYSSEEILDKEQGSRSIGSEIGKVGTESAVMLLTLSILEILHP